MLYKEPLATAHCSSSSLKETGTRGSSFPQHSIDYISSKFQRKDFYHIPLIKYYTDFYTIR